MPLNEIDKFERNNTDLSVNVFGYEDSMKRFVYPLRISKHERKDVVDLLLISNDSTNHYCLVNNLSKLLSSQVTKSKESRLFCRCLNGFRSKEALDKHKRYCNQHAAVRPEMPEPGMKLKFKNYNRSLRVPFIVYADFESFIEPIHTCQPDPNTSYTKQYQKHTPSSFCYYIKCFSDDVYKHEPVSYVAESDDVNVAGRFVETLEAHVKKIYRQFKFPESMIFTKVDEKRYKRETKCHICLVMIVLEITATLREDLEEQHTMAAS